MKLQIAECRLRIGLLLTIASLAVGCAATKAFREGDLAMRSGNMDQAVAAYRKAVQESPDDARFKIALERAMLAASRMHIERAREFEDKDQLEAAVSEYRLATEYDPSNRLAATKAATIERTVRERVELARPKPAITQMRATTPTLNRSSCKGS